MTEQLAEIFARPVSSWTSADYVVIDKGNRELGRAKVQEMLDATGMEGK